MLKFVKMHALGNDFVVIDARTQICQLTTSQIKALADRQRGIGFDQLLCLEETAQAADAYYRIFNADGREVGQCGNGARCVAHYLYLLGKPKTEPVILASKHGLMTVTPALTNMSSDNVVGKLGYYRVVLAIPSFEPEQIPVLKTNHGKLPWLEWEETKATVNHQRFKGVTVNVGNPHWIIPSEHLDIALLQRIGPLLNDVSQSPFPEGVNISLLRVDNRQKITISTYERGVGMTQACGSAAAAAAVVAILEGWCDNSLDVSMPGGHVRVTWAGDLQAVEMTGPAVLVFHGELDFYDNSK